MSVGFGWPVPVALVAFGVGAPRFGFATGLATLGLPRNELLPSALPPFNMVLKSARLPSFCWFLQALAPSA